MTKDVKEKIIAVVLLIVAIGIAYYQFGDALFSKNTIAKPPETAMITAEIPELKVTASVKLDREPIVFAVKRNIFMPPESIARRLWPDDYKDDEPEIDIDRLQPPTLIVQGMIWQGRRPQAIVNDTILFLGDSLLDAEVIEINRQGVTFNYQGLIFSVQPYNPITRQQEAQP